jgi:hypothetical protein
MHLARALARRAAAPRGARAMTGAAPGESEYRTPSERAAGVGTPPKEPTPEADAWADPLHPVKWKKVRGWGAARAATRRRPRPQPQTRPPRP